jgi:hypothetical protein
LYVIYTFSKFLSTPGAFQYCTDHEQAGQAGISRYLLAILL